MMHHKNMKPSCKTFKKNIPLIQKLFKKICTIIMNKLNPGNLKSLTSCQIIFKPSSLKVELQQRKAQDYIVG